MLALRHCYVTMSIQTPITKKVTLPAKKPLKALCEKRLQSSMFKKPSFYYFLEFHCKILNSYAIYRCKKMVKILNCYLNAKKSNGTLSKNAIFFGQPCTQLLSYICVYPKKTVFTLFVSVFDTYIGVLKSVKGNKNQFFYRLAEVKSSTVLNRN